MIKKFSDDKDLDTQKIIHEYAQNFGRKFCDSKLFKYGFINLTLIEDHEFLRACSIDAYGVTYTYPAQNSLKFMKRGFAISITHSLSELKNRDLLIDTVLYELIHAKIHLDKLEGKDDYGPIFLSYSSKIAAHIRIHMRINEHFEGGFFIKVKKSHDNKIINRVRSMIYRKKRNKTCNTYVIIHSYNIFYIFL